MRSKVLLVVVAAVLLTGCASTIYLGTPIKSKEHKASFLFDNKQTRVMNILDPDIPRFQFKSIMKRCVANGDKVIYLYFSCDKDGPPVSFYKDRQFGGEVDKHRVKEMKKRLMLCMKEDLKIVAWLFADDSPSISKADIEVQKKYISDVVDEFNWFISEYVIGLEIDEHMSSDRVAILVAHLDSKTDKKIGCHQLPGKCSYSAAIPQVNHHYHQYGFGKNPEYIKRATEVIRGQVGKPVVACEYHGSSDSPAAKQLGDAAMNGGAIGTGNGRN